MLNVLGTLPIVSARGLPPSEKVPREETRLLWQLLDARSEGLEELRLTRPGFHQLHDPGREVPADDQRGRLGPGLPALCV